MATVNILARLRIATEQVRDVQNNLGNEDLADTRGQHVERLRNVGNELDGK